MSDPQPTPPNAAAETPSPTGFRPKGFLQVLLRMPRFLLRRCPHCDGYPLMSSWIQFNDTCGNCGFQFIVEEGDFWGGVVIAYTFGGIFGIALGFTLAASGWFPWDTSIYIAAISALVFIVLFYPLAKAAWIHLLYLTRGQYADYAPPDMKDSAKR